jgi:hypothetical protein
MAMKKMSGKRGLFEPNEKARPFAPPPDGAVAPIRRGLFRGGRMMTGGNFALPRRAERISQ